MSVEQTKVVDFLSINPKNEVVLTISDHLDWTDEGKHLNLLQDKLNSYLSFIESGEIHESYPDSKGRKPVISIKALHPPSSLGLRFLAKAKETIEQAGIGFQFESELT